MGQHIRELLSKCADGKPYREWIIYTQIENVYFVFFYVNNYEIICFKFSFSIYKNHNLKSKYL